MTNNWPAQQKYNNLRDFCKAPAIKMLLFRNQLY